MLPLIFLAPITITALLSTSAGERIVDASASAGKKMVNGFVGLFHKKTEELGSCSAPPTNIQKTSDLPIYLSESSFTNLSSQQNLLTYCSISKNSIFYHSAERTSFPGSISSKCAQESQNFNNASFYSEVGQLWKQENRSDMSLLAYCRAVELNPTSTNYLALGSVALDGQNNPFAAITALEEALKLSNVSGDASLANQARMSLGRAYYQNFLNDPQASNGNPHFISQYAAEKMSKNLLKSLEYFNQVSGPASFELSYYKGIVKNALGKVVLAARTGDPEKQEFIEATAKAKKYFDEAIASLKESISFYESQSSTFLDPNYKIAEVLRSKINMEMDDLKGEQLVGRWKEVVQYYTKAFAKPESVFKNHADSLFQLATALEFSGDVRGIKFCEKALEAVKAETPQNNEKISKISLGLAFMYLDHSKKGEEIDLAKPLALFEAALSGKDIPTYAREFRSYALLIKQADPAKALKIFEGLLKLTLDAFAQTSKDSPPELLDDIDKEELYHYAELLFNQNDKSPFAEADLNKKLSFLDSFLRKGEIQNNPRTHYFIGRLEELRKNELAAIAAYQKSAELEKTNSSEKAEALFRIGKIYLRSDKPDSFTQAMSFHTQSADIYRRLMLNAKGESNIVNRFVFKRALSVVLTSLANGYLEKANLLNGKKEATSSDFKLALNYARKAIALYQEAKNPAKNSKTPEDADLTDAFASINSKLAEANKLRGVISKKLSNGEDSEDEDEEDENAEDTTPLNGSGAAEVTPAPVE